MALYVSTVSTSVVLDDLGFTIVHPTTSFDIEEQFTDIDCAKSNALTDAIRTGLLTWTRVSGGPAEVPTDYSPIGAPDAQDEGVNILNDVQVINFTGLSAKTVKKNGVSIDVKFLARTRVDFSYAGTNIGTRYLASFGTTTPTSDTVPFVCPQGMALVGLMFVSSVATPNCDIQVYKNASLAYTWQAVRAKRWAVKHSKTSLHTFGAGDRISVRHLNNTGGTSTNVRVALFFEYLDDADIDLTGTTV